MSEKLSKIRILKINGQAIVAPRKATIAEIRNWFERDGGEEVNEIHILSLTDRAGEGRRTDLIWAEIIESREFEAEDLPMYL